jgi:hypothetical protein
MVQKTRTPVSRDEGMARWLDPEVVSRLRNMELRARLVVEGFIQGMHRSPYHGFSVEFAEYRQYMPVMRRATSIGRSTARPTATRQEFEGGQPQGRHPPRQGVDGLRGRRGHEAAVGEHVAAARS